MLPDRALQLLTAYVDGELSSRQRKLVVCLLEKSPAARQILQQLQAHAQKVRQLPPRKLEPAFAAQVIDAVKHQSVNPPARRPVVARRRWPAWSRYAVAASLLAVLAGGLTWLVNRQPNAPGPNHIATNGAPKAPQAPQALFEIDLRLIGQRFPGLRDIGETFTDVARPRRFMLETLSIDIDLLLERQGAKAFLLLSQRQVEETLKFLRLAPA